MVANWDSNVGYAWWLMESYWVVLAEHYPGRMNTVLAYPSISEIPEAIAGAPIQTVQEDFTQRGWALLRKLPFLIKHRIHTIYFSDRPSRSWVYLFFRLVGVRRIIVHDHTPGLRTPPKGLKRLAKKWLNRLPWITADVCIGATDYLKHRFVEIGCMPVSKCHAANNGIPLEQPDPESAHQRFGIPQERTLIVTAARANRYKGGFQALEALSRLAQKADVPDWHYLYLGDGPDRDAMLDYARELGIEQRVSFPGRVSNVLALLPSAGAALHPSKGEVGYSLSILEYMLCGLPVIVPGNPSVCGATEHEQTGLVYPEGDVQALAEAIERLLIDSDSRRAMGERASRAVRERYSLERTHAELLGIVAGG